MALILQQPVMLFFGIAFDETCLNITTCSSCRQRGREIFPQASPSCSENLRRVCSASCWTWPPSPPPPPAARTLLEPASRPSLAAGPS
eukprot:768066-Hanusia_phi.AAC.1